MLECDEGGNVGGETVRFRIEWENSTASEGKDEGNESNRDALRGLS